MPKATVTRDSARYDLKSLPGAFVKLVPLSYGQVLARREMATKLSAAMGSDDLDIDLIQQKTREFDFEHCVEDHNLYHDEGETEKMDFKNPMTLVDLDPKVGQEIEELIDNLNNLDMTEDELKNLKRLSTVSTQTSE